MAVVFLRNKDKVSKSDIKKASEEYGDYIKVVVDIQTKDVTIGGEWHADGEKVLLEKDSKQKNVWGGGVDLRAKKVDVSALINIDPRRGNDSMEILDKSIRDKFVSVTTRKFGL